eukprot:393745_1
MYQSTTAAAAAIVELTATMAVAITVESVRDAIAVVISEWFEGSEETPLAIPATLTTVDPDVTNISAACSVSHGTLAISGSYGDAVTWSTSNAGNSMSIEGDFSGVTDALANLEYTGDTDWTGYDDYSLTVTYNVTLTTSATTV